MSVSTCNLLAVFITLCVVLQEGFGLPLSGQQPDLLPAPSSSSSSPQRHRLVRTKRCSCNSWLDKECIYFCHLDIIWVNTPSKILPYGLGSPLSRRRRSADDRCQCSNAADPTCSSFCHDSSQNPSIVVAEPSVDAKNHPNTESDLLLASLRSVVKSNMATAHHTASPRKRPSRAARLQHRTRK